MKKIIFLLSAVLWLFASCEGPAGRDGIDGLDGIDGRNGTNGRDGTDGRDGVGMYWFIKNYTVNTSQWQLIGKANELGSYYQASISVPELDRDIYENGNVFCYMFQRSNGVEVQTLLPFTVPYGESKANSDYLWTETYACDFSVGVVMFYVNYSDFVTNIRPPTTTFRVVLNLDAVYR